MITSRLVTGVLATLREISHLDVWLLIIAVLTLVASGVAAFVALLSLRRPKLEVTEVRLHYPRYMPLLGQIQAEQERYEGPEPDFVLLISLQNRGRVSALRVGGSVGILGLEPLNYPGYSDIRIRFLPEVPSYEVTIPPSDENRVLPAHPQELLTFWIAVRFPRSEGISLQEMMKLENRVWYRFTPENGAAIEGLWIVLNSGPPGPTLPANAGPVPDSERPAYPTKPNVF